jgi:hypothetical protein
MESRDAGRRDRGMGRRGDTGRRDATISVEGRF